MRLVAADRVMLAYKHFDSKAHCSGYHHQLNLPELGSKPMAVHSTLHCCFEKGLKLRLFKTKFLQFFGVVSWSRLCLLLQKLSDVAFTEVEIHIYFRTRLLKSIQTGSYSMKATVPISRNRDELVPPPFRIRKWLFVGTLQNLKNRENDETQENQRQGHRHCIGNVVRSHINPYLIQVRKHSLSNYLAQVRHVKVLFLGT
mmetsp:Transcript_8817/g.12872  ORF Transcript_8817/g.12872 Transcript_8817/m.12872 type:complete len:200 (+) Transcript_8817:216-815(+)